MLKLALALKLLIVIVVISTTTGCAVSPAAAASAQASLLCSGAGVDAARGMGGTTVAAAYASTALDTVRWASSGRSRVVVEPLKQLDGGSLVAFCYIDGAFNGVPQAPGADIHYTRALFLVPAIGSPILYEVGSIDTVNTAAPDVAEP
jgi:hypothetical protein